MPNPHLRSLFGLSTAVVAIIASQHALMAQEKRCIVAPFVPTIFLVGGRKPESIIAADFDGDDVLDIATGNGGENDISVLFGNGDGTFSKELRFGENHASYVLAADFNVDSMLDIVAVDLSAWVFLAIEPGAFELVQGFGLGEAESRSRYMPPPILADLNSDGLLDLATANSESNNISVLFGDTEATFLPQTRFNVGGRPWSLVAAELNDDGRLDLITTNLGSGDFSILLGAEKDSFLPEQRSGKQVGTKLVSAHLNDDKILDIATIDSTNDTISIFVGQGNATFSRLSDLPAGDYPFAIIAQDLNADGMIDLAMPNYLSDSIALLAGKGNAAFHAAEVFSAGTGPRSLVAADFSLDGMLDVAVGNRDGSSVLVLFNPLNNDCNQNAVLDHCDISEAASMDANQNGIPDECESTAPLFIRADCDGDGAATSGLSDAVFLLQFSFIGGREPPCLAACDADGDGQLVALTDAIYILTFVFRGGPEVPQPFPDCGEGQLSVVTLGCLSESDHCKN